jgi:hypothetical protein
MLMIDARKRRAWHRHDSKLSLGRNYRLITLLYNDPISPSTNNPDGGTRPVWQVAPESLIVSPAPDVKIGKGPVEIWGRTWADGRKLPASPHRSDQPEPKLPYLFGVSVHVAHTKRHSQFANRDNSRIRTVLFQFAD